MASDDTNANSMQAKIRAQFEAKSTKDLEQICYNRKDSHLYTEETFELIRDILKERSNSPSPPSSRPPPVQRAQAEDMGGNAGRGEGSDFFSFRTMITVSWVKFSYIFGTVAIVLLGLWLSVAGFANDNDSQLFAGLALFAIGPIAWRLICESWVVVFSIHETLVSIDKKLGRQ